LHKNIEVAKQSIRDLRDVRIRISWHIIYPLSAYPFNKA